MAKRKRSRKTQGGGEPHALSPEETKRLERLLDQPARIPPDTIRDTLTGPGPGPGFLGVPDPEGAPPDPEENRAGEGAETPSGIILP